MSLQRNVFRICLARAFCFSFYGNSLHSPHRSHRSRTLCRGQAQWRPQVLSCSFSLSLSLSLPFSSPRISYVSILNRLFMFEFYCIFLCFAFGQFFFAFYYTLLSLSLLLFYGPCALWHCHAVGYIKFHKSYMRKSQATHCHPLARTLLNTNIFIFFFGGVKRGRRTLVKFFGSRRYCLSENRLPSRGD